jgi:hypothetical protein
MEVTSSVHEIAKVVSVFDAIIWMAEATKQVSTNEPKASSGSIRLFFTDYLNNEETNECNIQELLDSLNEATFENTGLENYLNIDNELETGAAIRKLVS